MNTKPNRSKDKVPTDSQTRGRSKSSHQADMPPSQRNVFAKAQPLQVFEMPQLQTLKENFKRDVQIPIQNHTAIHHAKAPQRCQQHNNVITLYCISDHKPLCVTCMYQNNLHKLHKVVPINRATQDLQDEIKNYLFIVQKQLESTTYLQGQTHSHLEKAEKEFPDLILKIQKFYMSLHEMLVQKKQEQIAHVQQTWSKMRFQYSSLAKELEKINIFVVQKIAEIRSRNSEQNMLFNRNVASQLALLPSVIPSQVCKFHETTYQNQLKQFSEVRNVINNKLVFTSPFKEVISRNSSRKANSFIRSLTPSPQPLKNRQNNSNKSGMKDIKTSRNDHTVVEKPLKLSKSPLIRKRQKQVQFQGSF